MKRNKNEDAHWGSSLFRFPWHQKERLSKIEEVLDDTLVSWYKEKHREPSIKEIELINSLEKNVRTVEVLALGNVDFMVKEYKDINVKFAIKSFLH